MQDRPRKDESKEAWRIDERHLASGAAANHSSNSSTPPMILTLVSVDEENRTADDLVVVVEAMIDGVEIGIQA